MYLLNPSRKGKVSSFIYVWLIHILVISTISFPCRLIFVWFFFPIHCMIAQKAAICLNLKLLRYPKTCVQGFNLDKGRLYPVF